MSFILQTLFGEYEPKDWKNCIFRTQNKEFYKSQNGIWVWLKDFRDPIFKPSNKIKEIVSTENFIVLIFTNGIVDIYRGVPLEYLNETVPEKFSNNIENGKFGMILNENEDPYYYGNVPKSYMMTIRIEDLAFGINNIWDGENFDLKAGTSKMISYKSKFPKFSFNPMNVLLGSKTKNRYFYIGSHSIIRFDAPEKITSLVSAIGNSAIYAYATSKNYTFFLDTSQNENSKNSEFKIDFIKGNLKTFAYEKYYSENLDGKIDFIVGKDIFK